MEWRLLVDAPHASPEAAVAVDEALYASLAPRLRSHALEERAR